MPTDSPSPRLCAYQAQRLAIQHQFEAARQALWDAQDAYHAPVTPPTQETSDAQ